MPLLVLFVLLVMAIRAGIRRLLGPRPARPKPKWRITINAEGWRAFTGLVPGALVASFLFPTSILLSTLLYTFCVDAAKGERWIDLAVYALECIDIAVMCFLIFAVIWGCGIALLTPVWGVLFWCGANGPFAAAALGAVASFGIARAFDLARIDRTDAALLAIVTASGAVGGAVVWWTTYRPDVLRTRLRRCPVFGAA